MSTARVAAVVVTFNRRALLERLVDRLLSIPELDRVLIVNNASTDDTPQFLAGLTDHRVRHRTLVSNLGGAGGFQAGLQWSYDEGFELAWMMDDDGIPTPDCLRLLLAHEGDFDFWGPAVLAEQEPAKLCFPVRLPGSATVARTLQQLASVAHDGIVDDVVIPFNGVLVSRDLVGRIGTPRAEFFIWGDDVEYLWRARADGARVATVVNAHFLHPATDDLGTPMMFGRTTYNHSPSDLKHYAMARNNTVNLLAYRSVLHAVAFWVKTAWFYTFVKPSWARLKLSAQAISAGLRGDFSGHQRFLAPGQPDTLGGQLPTSRVAVVVVTYLRAELLDRFLCALECQTCKPDAVFIVDNGGDDATAQVLAAHNGAHNGLRLHVDHTGENLGGAGGFNRGMRAAYEAGFDFIWLMDDDVRPAPWALEVLARDGGDLLACVREDRHGNLVEKAAIKFDLANPLRIRPKVASVESTFASRAQMPARVAIENAAFEGFWVSRRVVASIGLPDPSLFIFYDDVDFELRARRAGFEMWALRDALMRRQLDFAQENDLASWKGVFMYRNLFVVHFRYGENLAVRLKPFAITAAVVALSPFRGGRREAKNVRQALREALKMRRLDPRAKL